MTAIKIEENDDCGKFIETGPLKNYGYLGMQVERIELDEVIEEGQ